MGQTTDGWTDVATNVYLAIKAGQQLVELFYVLLNGTEI